MYIIHYWNGHAARWNKEVKYREFEAEEELSDFIMETAYTRQDFKHSYNLHLDDSFRILKVYKVESELSYQLDVTPILITKKKEMENNMPSFFSKKKQDDMERQKAEWQVELERTKVRLKFLEDKLK